MVDVSGVFPTGHAGATPNPGTVLQVFDGQSLNNWCMAGRGTFHVIDGRVAERTKLRPGFALVHHPNVPSTGAFTPTVQPGQKAALSQSRMAYIDYLCRLAPTRSDRAKNVNKIGFSAN